MNSDFASFWLNHQVILPSMRFPALIWGESNASSWEAEESDVDSCMEPGTQVISVLGWPSSLWKATTAAGPASLTQCLCFPRVQEYKDIIESVLREKVPLRKGSWQRRGDWLHGLGEEEAVWEVCQVGKASGGRIKKNGKGKCTRRHRARQRQPVGL